MSLVECLAVLSPIVTGGGLVWYLSGTLATMKQQITDVLEHFGKHVEDDKRMAKTVQKHGEEIAVLKSKVA